MLKSNKIERKLKYIFIFILILYQSCDSNRIRYPQFEGGHLDLSYQESKNLLLLLPSGNFNADTLASILQTYDLAYELASEISGREPNLSPLETEKLPLAIVPATCGPGCGRLGRKGIEITEEKFRQIYDQFLKHGKHDHLFFYELGRNFWFYEASAVKRKEMDDIRTGFAVFFRDLILNELKLNVAPINGKPYFEYMEDKKNRWKTIREEWLPSATPDEIENLRKKYFPNPSLFWSMLWWERYQMHGKEGIQKALQDLQLRPPVSENDWLEFFNEGSR